MSYAMGRLAKTSLLVLPTVVFDLMFAWREAGNALTDKYAGEELSYWINEENIPFLASIIMFGLM